MFFHFPKYLLWTTAASGVIFLPAISWLFYDFDDSQQVVLPFVQTKAGKYMVGETFNQTLRLQGQEKKLRKKRQAQEKDKQQFFNNTMNLR